VASAGSVPPGGNANQAPQVSAILLDAGGVLVFPEPANVLPPLRAAGVDPDPAALERAHYRAMAAQDQEPLPPVRTTWWRDYLLTYVVACGVAEDRAEPLALEMSQWIRGHSWTHAGLGVMDGLRAVAALGLPMGVVSNSDGSVEGDLRRIGVCHVPDGPGPPPGGTAGPPAGGVPVGVVLDSAVVGVAKPDPEIFRLALAALDVPAGGGVLHVGDSLRYDVAGALTAGLRPVHMDPYGFCPAPDGHRHVRSLAELASSLISDNR
jgi:putative hydrolase of the HAD superfamily